MIVSALLTSVGINLGLFLFFLLLYSVLRKQPPNLKIYSPRLLADGTLRPEGGFGIDSLLPSPGWVRAAWAVPEDDLLASGGLDAVVFVRIFVFCLKVFSVAGAIGIFILLPINYLGDQLRDIDFSDIPNKSIDLFSISNVKDGSNRLWIHFSAAYLITGVVCYLLYSEYKFIYHKRLAVFHTSGPQPQHFTILVRGIPIQNRSSVNDTVHRFFMEYHPSTYLSHIVVHRTSKLRSLITDAENLYGRLTHLKSRSHTSENLHRGGFLGSGRKVDVVGDYAKKLENVEENLRIEQPGGSQAGEEVPAAFVSFKSRYGAAAAAHIQQSINPTLWVTEQAPEPHDIYWPFFSTSFMQRWIFKLVVLVASVALIIVFLLPVTFVQGLTNLEQLEALFPFLKGILTTAVVSQVITGYLPSLILLLLLSVVPPIMKLFSSMQGFIANSEIEKSACTKMLWFTIWNIFFANVLTGSVASQLQIFLDPKNIPSVLAVVVPAQASFFIAYVVTSWTSLSVELTRLVPLIGDWIGRHCLRCTDDGVHVPSIPYHSEIPRILLVELLGLVYFLLAPLILPFLLVFFFIGYIIYRNQLLNVYLPKYETGGKFWPIVHNSTIFSLLLMQAIAIGIFGLKKLPLASGLILPLPVLTLLYNEYCRKRFLPIFVAYPAESLIKKDREEQNDPEMNVFFNKLVTAYLEPALMPVSRPLNTNDHTTPLLSSA
ncbi:CSC1-like protein HYP1 [Iris pallida]|uniref:CSC1-like protein HYP1 n=1 Tax=Iris pallida TaxID=29817 RepID=A0AAX6HMZ1_IRIPA|nr:CSC1-like protein HYP1 [Iris pallida]